MANRVLRDNKKYEDIKNEYSVNLLSLEEACKKNNVSMRTYYNLCKRINKQSIAHDPQKPQTGGKINNNEKIKVEEKVMNNAISQNLNKAPAKTRGRKPHKKECESSDEYSDIRDDDDDSIAVSKLHNLVEDTKKTRRKK